jgi:GrpB-like predicted nucleotidyltransferase (UPF0157 family)
MKLLLFLLIAFIFNVLSATDFQTVKQLFADGRFEQCDQTIKELLKKKLPDDQRSKLLAMQEYLLGATPSKISETVKQAKKTAEHSDWLTADLLGHAMRLIRRAEDWKARGIPEYQELSDVAAELLKRAKDDGNPETALKIVFLRTGNYNLNGEYSESQKLIQETLRLYYPPQKLRGRNVPDGAIRLLILSGDQYIGSGVRNHDPREKLNSFSQAAKYFLRAVNVLPTTDPRFQMLSDRLYYCREILRLLGYQLKLPTSLKSQRTVKTAMIDEMLHQRRFHDVVLALENNSEPAMRIRYAVALSACGELDKAWSIVQNFSGDEPTLLLAVARNFLSNGKKVEAAILLRNFLNAAPNSPDALAVGQQCTQLLIEQNKLQEAADCLLKLSAGTTNIKVAEQSKVLAARCFYLMQDYEKCIALIDALPPDSERSILAGQAEVQRKNYSGAIRRLEPLLAKQVINRAEVLKLLIFCELENDSTKAADYLEMLLQNYPNDSDSLKYAIILLDFYKKHPPKAEKFQTLGNFAAQKHLNTSEAVILIAECVQGLNDSRGKELLETLLRRNNFTESELLALFARLNDRKQKLKFGKKYASVFKNSPEYCTLFLTLAKLEYEEQMYLEALNRCEILLAQKEVWQHKEVKILQAEILSKLQRHEEVRKCLQQLLLTKLSPEEKPPIVLKLAQAWEQSNEYGKAIAVAWTAVPFDGKIAPENKPAVKDLLQLIIRNAEKIKSVDDKTDADEILATL